MVSSCPGVSFSNHTEAESFGKSLGGLRKGKKSMFQAGPSVFLIFQGFLLV